MNNEKIADRIKELIILVADFELKKEDISSEEDGIVQLVLNSLATIRLCAKPKFLTKP